MISTLESIGLYRCNLGSASIIRLSGYRLSTWSHLKFKRLRFAHSKFNTTTTTTTTASVENVKHALAREFFLLLACLPFHILLITRSIPIPISISISFSNPDCNCNCNSDVEPTYRIPRITQQADAVFACLLKLQLAVCVTSEFASVLA